MRGVVGILQMLLQDLSMAFKLQVTSLVMIFCKPLESKRSKTGVYWTFLKEADSKKLNVFNLSHLHCFACFMSLWVGCKTFHMALIASRIK